MTKQREKNKTSSKKRIQKSDVREGENGDEIGQSVAGARHTAVSRPSH